jgi:hypothetical protein
MKWNTLSISALILLTIGVVLLIPSMGGSISIIGVSLVFFIAYFLLKNKERQVHIGATIVMWSVVVVFMFSETKRLVFKADKKIEQNLYIVCGIKGYPKLNEIYEWQKTLTVPTDRVVVTSSPIDKIPGVFFIKVGEQNKEQQVKGIGRQYSFCRNNIGLIILTLDNEGNSSEMSKMIEVIREKYCKTSSANTAQAPYSATPRP